MKKSLLSMLVLLFSLSFALVGCGEYDDTEYDDNQPGIEDPVDGNDDDNANDD